MATLKSIFRYPGTGSAQVLNVPPYLSKTHITVYVNGVVETGFTWLTASTIQLTAPADASVVVQRKTSHDKRLVDYNGAVPLTEPDLDTDSLQAFYMGQEARDVYDDLVSLSDAPLEDAITAAVQASISATGAAASATEAAASATSADASKVAAEAAAAAAEAGGNSIVVAVHKFATGGTGTDVDPWTGWDTAISWNVRTTYEFSDGYFQYAESPNFGKFKLELRGTQNTVIRHTGTGWAFVCDAGEWDAVAGGQQLGIERVRVSGIRVESTAAAAGGCLIRGIHRSDIHLEARNVPNKAFAVVYCVLTTFDLTHTAYYEGAQTQPTFGLHVDRRGPTETTSACVFRNWWLENCTSHGMYLEYCSNGVFIGGSSEANPNNIFISETSYSNTFVGPDIEVATGGYDVRCDGYNNTFLGLLTTGAVIINGKANTIYGGLVDAVTVGGQHNTFDGVTYAANGGAFTDGGYQTAKRRCRSAVTSLMDPDYLTTGLVLGDSGTSIQRHLSATAALTFAAPGAVPGASGEQTIAVPGAALGDTVVLGLPQNPHGWFLFTAWVTAANFVNIRATQVMGTPVSIPEATYRADVWQH